MDLLKKLYLLTAENVKRARERQDPTGVTQQKHSFKVNDIVLVRDIISGILTPRYIPNYQIIVIHGLNRIVVRDEKGNETVRRASHLKSCELKDKVTAMVQEHDEYRNFGRSMKLLLHTKDIPEPQFTSETERSSKILPNTKIAVIEVDTNTFKQYIVDCGEVTKEGDEIPPSTAPWRENTNTCDRSKKLTWFANSVNCISKWSKVLKKGVKDSAGVGAGYTAMEQPETSKNLTFSFFL